VSSQYGREGGGGSETGAAGHETVKQAPPDSARQCTEAGEGRGVSD